MKCMNYQKYVEYPSVNISNRTWPSKTIIKAPIWCSVDLRDGNQALSVPMNIDQKIQMFKLLVSIGFKEIEIGFPSASDVEYKFVRRLIKEKMIPDDVTIQVLTPARENLIRKTFDSLSGVKKAIVHLYNSTSKVQREVVFSMSKDEIMNIAIEGTKLIKILKDEKKNDGILFEYTPESFSGTELDYTLEICSAVINVWEPSPEKKIIINLPSTVEMSTPNVYADRIEWFCRHIKSKESVIMSVHTHNDRGTAVASAELAVMAGAERVEGALFGNGERSGNMDIVTMALNLFSQGVNPELDFSNINDVIEVYRKCTRMEIHPRHPYAGELVYTAFSGSHQDAINKGMKAQKETESLIWNVPYLPIDPKDVGRTYEAIIKINSQSGKGGVAYVMEKDFGINIPKWMQPEFGGIVQSAVDRIDGELTSEQIYELFNKEYIQIDKPCKLTKCHINSNNEEENYGASKQSHISSAINRNGQVLKIEEDGNGPVDAFVKGLRKELGVEFSLEEYAEHAISSGENALAVTYIMIKDQKENKSYGVGIDSNISLATIKAVLSSLNRLLKGQ